MVFTVFTETHSPLFFLKLLHLRVTNRRSVVMLLVAVSGKVQKLVIYPFTVMTHLCICIWCMCTCVCVIITQFGVTWIKKLFQTSHVACVWEISKIIDSGIFSFSLKLLGHSLFYKGMTFVSFKNKHISVGLQNLYSLFPGHTTMFRMHWGGLYMVLPSYETIIILD